MNRRRIACAEEGRRAEEAQRAATERDRQQQALAVAAEIQREKEAEARREAAAERVREQQALALRTEERAALEKAAEEKILAEKAEADRRIAAATATIQRSNAAIAAAKAAKDRADALEKAAADRIAAAEKATAEQGDADQRGGGASPAPSNPVSTNAATPRASNETAGGKKTTPATSVTGLPDRTPKGISLETESFYLSYHAGLVKDVDALLRNADIAVQMAHRAGLRCGSITIFKEWTFTKGWTLECNSYDYKYYIEDKGRGQQIRIAD
jgi:hypothetical protein